MAAKIQLRRDTAAVWASVNPTLALGEPGVETDTYKVKVGDGTSDWNTLPYSITTQFADLNGKPTTIAGYAINDAYTKAEVDAIIESPSGNLTGSVFADDSTVMVDGVSATINLANNTTTDLAEGTNLYYTDVRADARIALQVGANLDLSSKSTTDLSDADQTVQTTDDVTFNSVTGNIITSQIDSADSSAIEIQTDVTMLAGLTVGNHIIPSSSENIDLGSASARFRDLYLSGNSAIIGDLALKRHTSGGLIVSDHSTGNPTNITTHNIVANDITANDIAVGGNLTMTGYIAGPATMTIDPAVVGDNTGTLVVAGNLQVDGTTTTINSQTLEVEDKNVVLGPNAANDAANNGAGLTVTQPDTSNATLIYDTTSTQWEFNKDLDVAGDITVSGTVDGVDIAARDSTLTATTTTANAALPKAGGTMTGALIATSLDNGTSFGSNRMLKLIGTSTTDNSRMGIHFTGNTGIGNGLAIIEAVNEDQSAGHTSLRMHTYSGSWNENNLVLKSGNVGIGTDSPSDVLEVSRTSTDQTAGLTLTNLQAGGYGSGIVWQSKRSDSPYLLKDAAKIVVAGENAWNSDGNTASQMQFWTNKDNTLTKHMTLTKNGYLGIGTDAPSGKFVVSNGGAEGIEFFPGSSSNQNTTQHYNRSGSVYVKNRTIALNHEWANGTTDPAMNLIPDGDSTFLIIKAKAGTYSQTANISLYGTNPNINGGSLVSRGSIQAQTDGTAFGTKLRLFTNNTSNVETRAITIDANQNVGIGTDNPTYNFHVTGSGDTVAAVTAGASSVAALNLGNSTTLADGGIRYDNSADALIFRAANAEKMRITSDGETRRNHSSNTDNSKKWWSTTSNNFGEVYEYDYGTNLYFKKTRSVQGYDQMLLHGRYMPNQYDVSFELKSNITPGVYRHMGIALNHVGTENSSTFDYLVLRQHPSSSTNNQVRIDLTTGTTGDSSGSSVPNFHDGTKRKIMIQKRANTLRMQVHELNGTVFTYGTITGITWTNSSGYFGFNFYESADSYTFAEVSNLTFYDVIA